MQRRAAAAYVAILVVIAAGTFAASATASEPAISIDADHELTKGQSVSLGGTTYTVASLDAKAGSATIEWNGGNDSVSVTEGKNVTLGGTTYVGHFEGSTLQLSDDPEAYQEDVRAQKEHAEFVHNLEVLSFLSGFSAFLLLTLAYMPVRGD
jgi:hypothetical protein